MIGNCVMTILPSGLWMASVHVDYPYRYALIWLAIAGDIWAPTLLVLFSRGALFPNWEKFQKWSRTAFEFSPGINIEHKTERTNAFVCLVFGYSVVALLYQNQDHIGLNSFFGKAVLGLIQAFAYNWIYFEIDSFNLHTHAIRRHFFSGE
jgi:low temperature requirement protein LtrA